MTPEQSASYVFAQAVAAQAEIQSMTAENQFREMQGKTIAYGEEAFMQVIERYRLSHEDITALYSNSESEGPGYDVPYGGHEARPPGSFFKGNGKG